MFLRNLRCGGQTQYPSCICTAAHFVVEEKLRVKTFDQYRWQADREKNRKSEPPCVYLNVTVTV